MAGAERAVETEATIPAGAIIGRINGAVTSGDTMMSPEQRVTLLKTMLPAIKVEEVAKRLADEFTPKAVAFIAVLPSSADVPTETDLLDIGVKALAVKPTKE